MESNSRPAFEQFPEPPEKMYRVELRAQNGLVLIRYVTEWAAVVEAVRKAADTVTVNVVMYLRSDSLAREDILGDGDDD